MERTITLMGWGRSTLARSTSMLLFALLLTACGGGGSSDPVPLAPTLTPAGSNAGGIANDGPIANGTVTARDPSGAVVAETTTDAQGRYALTIPPGATFPIAVSITGGTDLVTDAPPDVPVASLLLASTQGVGNANPFGAVHVAVAACATGDASSLGPLLEAADAALRFGLQTGQASAVSDSVPAAGFTDYLLAGEVFAEAIRRAVAINGGDPTDVTALQAFIDALGCDLVDGVLDGQGTGADPRVTAALDVARLEVQLEVVQGRLQRGGNDVLGALAGVVQEVEPDAPALDASVFGSTDRIADVRDAAITVAAMQQDTRLLDLAIALGEIASGDRALDTLGGLVEGGIAESVASARSGFADLDDAALASGNDARTGGGTGEVSVTLQPSSSQLATEGTVTLVWSSENAQLCQATGAWTGTRATSGEERVGIGQTSAFTLTCFGDGGVGSDSAEVGVTAAAPPTIDSFTASETRVAARGASVDLTWSTTNASACVASGSWSGDRATGATEAVVVGANSSYTLTCSGDGGETSETVTVDVAPTLTFSADPPVVEAGGGASTLSWTSTDLDSCTALGGWSGSRDVEGTEEVQVVDATRYTLDCTGRGGDISRSVVVSPLLDLQASAMLVANRGDTVTLSWDAGDGTQCVASGGWDGDKASVGSEQVAVPGNSDFTLTCDYVNGPGADTVTVLVVPTVNISASPSVIDFGGTSTITWTTLDATQCVAEGGWSMSTATADSQEVGPLEVDETFTLTCSNGLAEATSSASVTVRSVSLAWTEPLVDAQGQPFLNPIDRYIVERGTTSGVYVQQFEFPGTDPLSAVIPLEAGDNFLIVRAIDVTGCEGLPSNEVQATVP